ncbi:hypothetical protein [Streptococcus anginosus]|uniref:hypothetical protein n=1 Tax=Streptococcus anginosus TaxID=1328 RepID=UPI00124879FB|nr:hypothetical protein [Streptococcus anginosus]KAA9306635.1 hypothetical protein F6I00_03770 [Streptococcus anginosus]KAB0647491.1 hypothetical protein F6I01_01925 [Aerococcus sanguinicola]
MSLYDIAQSIKKEGFDPRKDSANGPKPIPAGTYFVILKKAQFNIAESGWESIQYQFEVRGGDHDGRTEFASFGTLDEWKGKSLEWATERTIKFFHKAIVLSGDDVLKKDFEDGKSLEEALERKAIGSYYNLVITETESKGKTYRSYDLEEAEEAAPLKNLDINDDVLPF